MISSEGIGYVGFPCGRRQQQRDFPVPPVRKNEGGRGGDISTMNAVGV
jgi:hypothetical protein